MVLNGFINHKELLLTMYTNTAPLMTRVATARLLSRIAPVIVGSSHSNCPADNSHLNHHRSSSAINYFPNSSRNHLNFGYEMRPKFRATWNVANQRSASSALKIQIPATRNLPVVGVILGSPRTKRHLLAIITTTVSAQTYLSELG